MDIVERLRDYDPTRANSREAADEIERLRAAAEEALATLEAIELLDPSRFGMKTGVVTASCNKLHRALEPKP